MMSNSSARTPSCHHFKRADLPLELTLSGTLALMDKFPVPQRRKEE
jgi:hypothetical protein